VGIALIFSISDSLSPIFPDPTFTPNISNLLLIGRGRSLHVGADLSLAMEMALREP
jgi:hypothetical protein